jgi:tetratricopeptide (TPR) repeat protein
MVGRPGRAVSRTSRVWRGAVCLLVAAASGSGSTDVSAAEPQTLVELVAAYRGGQAETAVREFSQWSETRVEAEAGPAVVGAQDAGTLAALVMLHTEAAGRLGLFGTTVRWPPSAPLLNPYRGPLRDVHVYSRHALEGIERLLLMADVDSRLPVFLRDWHLLASSYHAVSGGAQDWPPALDAVQRFPSDAMSWLSYAALLENSVTVRRDGSGFSYLGGRLGRVAARDINDGRRPSVWTVNRRGDMLDRTEAQATESTLRKVLTLDPNLQEASLRLGRLYQISDRPREAREVLTPLLDRAPTADTFVRYLTLLFLGELDNQEGQSAAAEAHFRSALQVIPGARSARVALVELLARHNPGDATRMTMADLMRGIDTMAADPWDLYPSIQLWREAELLAALRGFVRVP